MKTSAIFSLIAIAMTLNLNAANNNGELNNETTADVYFSSALDVFVEETLDVSDWMLDMNAFESTVEIIEISDWMLDVESFGEPKVLVEDWMLDESFFDEHEDMLEIDETWMFDVDAFGGKETDFEEDNIEVEEWMFSVASFSDDFEEGIRPIEKWMFNF